MQALIDCQQVTPALTRTHPWRSLLLRALNGRELEPSLQTLTAHEGDRYLLCSDGLTDVVGDEQIARTLATPEPETAAGQLIKLALDAGGPDNITVVLADVAGCDPNNGTATTFESQPPR